jgi:hypothetical protein
LIDFQIVGLGGLLLAEFCDLVLIAGVFFEPSCQVLDGSCWFVGVDVGEAASNDLADALLLQVLQEITVHN